MMLHFFSYTGQLCHRLTALLIWWLTVKELNCQCRVGKRHGINPWVRKIPLEAEIATYSSILAWRIPWTEDPGRLQSMGSQRVRHNLAIGHPCLGSSEYYLYPYCNRSFSRYVNDGFSMVNLYHL